MSNRLNKGILYEESLFPTYHSNNNVAAKIHESWIDKVEMFKDGSVDYIFKYFSCLSNVTFTPDLKDCLRVFKLPFDKVKVVIINSQPYANNHSNGLALGSQLGTPTKALKLLNEATGNNDLSLLSWEEQGVLLLNLELVTSVEPNKVPRNSTSKLTLSVLDALNSQHENLVFISLGFTSKELGLTISKHKFFCIDSLFTATLENIDWVYCDCFNLTNIYLKKHGKTPIRWSNTGYIHKS